MVEKKKSGWAARLRGQVVMPEIRLPDDTPHSSRVEPQASEPQELALDAGTKVVESAEPDQVVAEEPRDSQLMPTVSSEGAPEHQSDTAFVQESEVPSQSEEPMRGGIIHRVKGWLAPNGDKQRNRQKAQMAPTAELGSVEQMTAIYAAAEAATERQDADVIGQAVNSEAASGYPEFDATPVPSVELVEMPKQAEAPKVEQLVYEPLMNELVEQLPQATPAETPSMDGSSVVEGVPENSVEEEQEEEQEQEQEEEEDEAEEQAPQEKGRVTAMLAGFAALTTSSFKNRLMGIKRSAGSSTLDSEEDEYRFTSVPIRALYGYLPDVRESDALEYALGYAAEFLQQQGMVFYDAFPYKRGFAFEVQQGGDGRSFLPEIIEYFNSQGEFEPGENVRVVVKTATRKAEVFRTREGLDFVILPESSEKAPTAWLKGTSKLTPAINRRTGFFVASAVFFATGFIAMLFSSMLTRYQDYDPVPPPKVEYVNFAESPSGQWNQMKNVPENSYIKALRFRNGKWESPEVVVDLEVIKAKAEAAAAAANPAQGEASPEASSPEANSTGQAAVSNATPATTGVAR